MSKPVDHIRDLVPDPKNRRKHNPRNIGMVVDALHRVGAARSIVIDEDNVILAGNGVTEAAAEAGITKVRVIDVAGDELVAVRRIGLSDSQKRDLAIADNRTAELAEWNAEQLSEDMAAGLTMEPWFTDEELARLVQAKPGDGLTDPDDVPAERETDIVPGDLFQLGRHRLICGDSTDALVVDRLLAGVKPHLMVTDPPYGVEYDPSWRAEVNGDGPNSKRATGKVLNDDRADWREAWALFPGDVAYVWHADVFSPTVADSLRGNNFEMRALIVWAKQRHTFGRGHYHHQHEPCWYAVRKSATGHWSGDRTQTTLWHIDNNRNNETGHGTQKPVECMRKPIENNSSPGQAVYEPFSGSGTTIIAAEQTGRACYAIELNPSYVQMAIDRWEAFTGQKAEKVNQ